MQFDGLKPLARACHRRTLQQHRDRRAKLVGDLFDSAEAELARRLTFDIAAISGGSGRDRCLTTDESRAHQHCGNSYNSGMPPAAAESGLVKMTVMTNAIAAVERAIELTGNPALSRVDELERQLRDVLCSRSCIPQNDSILIAAGPAAFRAVALKGGRQ